GLAYVLWGLYQGLLLAAHRFWTGLVRRPAVTAPATAAAPPHQGARRAAGVSRMFTVVKAIFFFHLMCVGWLLFRAGAIPSTSSQLHLVEGYLAAVFKLFPPSGISPLAVGIGFLGFWVFFFQWKHELMDRFSEWP